jgi:hypothetical protein
MGEHGVSLTPTDPVPYSFNLDLTAAGRQSPPPLFLGVMTKKTVIKIYPGMTGDEAMKWEL